MRSICFEGLFSGDSEDIESSIAIENLLNKFNSLDGDGKEIRKSQYCCTARIDGKTLVIGLPEYGEIDDSFAISSVRREGLVEFIRETGIRKLRFEENPNGCKSIVFVNDSGEPIDLKTEVEIEAPTIRLVGYMLGSQGLDLRSRLIARPAEYMELKIGSKTILRNIELRANKLDGLIIGVWTEDGRLGQEYIDWINSVKKIGYLTLRFAHRKVSSVIKTRLGRKRFIESPDLEELVGMPLGTNIEALDVWIDKGKGWNSQWQRIQFRRRGTNWSIER